MENKFDLKAYRLNKKGTADRLINMLIAVLLVSALAGTIFTYLGGGATGLANASLNPGVPVWLPPVLIVVIAVGLLYLILSASGIKGGKR